MKERTKIILTFSTKPFLIIGMTIRLRNVILLIWTFSTGGILAGSQLFPLFYQEKTRKLLSEVTDSLQRWWFVYEDTQAAGQDYIFFGILLLTIFSFFSAIIVRRFLKRSPAGEVFFFIIFLFSLAIEALRLLNPLLLEIQSPPYYGYLVTKVVVFGRYFATFALFSGSLHNIGIDNQKSGTLLMLALFLSGVLSAFTPVDSTRLLQNMLYYTGAETERFILFIFLSVFTIGNFIWTAATRRTADSAILAAAAIALITGKELACYAAGLPSAVGGTALLVTGTYLFAKKEYQMHLWR
ncbi:MAG: hypothetical protein K9L68_13160 [Spirochaetales bacterium]|nr:hypothetical protein [Spirochaetales bacterium]MCF7939543.1 hypothetical protein [Spirochaetales bacterium]